MKRLEDRVAVVTGSAQGMGLAIAKALGDEGAKIVITDVNKEQIDLTLSELKEAGYTAAGYRMDVTNKDDVNAVFKSVNSDMGSVDILVNNAGGSLHTPHILEEIEEKHWDLVVDVNLKGAFFCCQAAIPYMAAQGKGAIVNISALAAHYRASLAGVQYTAAKAGVEGLTRQLAYDWGEKGIRVTGVAPTVTMTGARMQGLWDGKGDEEQKKVLSNIPLRRLSTPSEIASAVVFLASDEASYISGVNLDVSGGRFLR
ncbi:MAG: SDR family NAD(P)-dependent oxidoreductase [Spirochaetales bacterium]|uniref:SDR family NAD(P)-dependent oxidoreductase n=1 Tax=Candidatus Thalassospirochaeta sargassi TaxID=3119039 RepID=A0AAJ1IKA2_9SPIO|nr:SDR family NAD(P)-dependent oxidoreductase [Spirochaetales bacterium]